MSAQYGELQPTSSWDRFGSLGHPSRFQRVSRLVTITVRHSSSGRQPNFALLNRGRHLYSAGRPSRWAWALAHIVVRLRFVAEYCNVTTELIASQHWRKLNFCCKGKADVTPGFSLFVFELRLPSSDHFGNGSCGLAYTATRLLACHYFCT